jgi:uncharacterized protein YutE (UPF0331/DUF86 family)
MSPGSPDTATLRRHLLALDEALAQLAKHTGRPVEVLAQDLDERWAVERGLQLCVQGALDIATHLAASSGRDVPDYTTAIEELGRLGVVPQDLAHRLRPLAGFRNVLVHGYLRLDLRRVHEVLNVHLDDIRELARHVNARLVASARGQL